MDEEKKDEEKIDEEKKYDDTMRTLVSVRISFQGVMITVIALILFGFIFWSFKKNVSKTPEGTSPEIILFGDSIFAYYTDERSLANLLSEKTGMTVFDASFGGSCLSYCDYDGRLDDTADSTSMAAICDAFSENDFRYQINTFTLSPATDYFKDRLTALSKVNISGAKVIIVEHLLNDYHRGARLHAGSDPYDDYTYEGALRKVLLDLHVMCNKARIIVVAPPLTYYPDKKEVVDENGETKLVNDYTHMTSADQRDFGGGTVTDYLSVQERIATERGVEYLRLSDAISDAISKAQELNDKAADDIFALSVDGIHPNEEATEILASYLADYILGE